MANLVRLIHKPFKKSYLKNGLDFAGKLPGGATLSGIYPRVGTGL